MSLNETGILGATHKALMSLRYFKYMWHFHACKHKKYNNDVRHDIKTIVRALLVHFPIPRGITNINSLRIPFKF